ncbi:hypothetical protein ACFLYE_01155 [Chloroflexota bacterium]
MVKTKVRTSRLRTKRGAYGRSKLKAFTIFQNNQGHWLSTRFLCVSTGIPYHSLARHLPRWWDFGYVIRQPCGGLGDYEYHATEKAHTWLALAKDELPNARPFLSELSEWQKAIQPDFDKLMTLPFTKFIPAYAKVNKAFKKSQAKAAKARAPKRLSVVDK